MIRSAILLASCLAFSDTGRAASASLPTPPQRFTIPSGPSAIPADISNQMNRQEQRLDQIDNRLTVIEKSVGRMEEDVRQLVKTDNIVDFIVGMIKLFIPGMFLTLFALWVTRRWKEQKPNSSASPS